MLDTQNCLQNYIKNVKATKFILQSAFYTFKEALAKFYLSTTFGSSFIISFVAPTRSSTSYAYLVIKIGNRNLKGDFDRPDNLVYQAGEGSKKIKISGFELLCSDF